MSSMEDLRFWTIREVGKLHDTSVNAGTHLHALRKEVDALTARLDAKAEATAVVSELDRLRRDLGEEFRKNRLELESAFQELTGQTQSAFQQVGIVEANLQAHVQHGFAGAVHALQALDTQTKERLEQLEAQIVVARAEAAAAAAPPPAPVQSETRRVASAPVLNLRADFSGCAAGPFACGCGQGATKGEDAGFAPVSATEGAPHNRFRRGPLCANDQACSGATGPTNGECHCQHVTKLQEEVADLKAKYQHFRASFGAKPFMPDAAKGAGHDPVLEEPSYGTGVSAEEQSLKIGPMGSLARLGPRL